MNSQRHNDLRLAGRICTLLDNPSVPTFRLQALVRQVLSNLFLVSVNFFYHIITLFFITFYKRKTII
jgi:hypothetical protein